MDNLCRNSKPSPSLMPSLKNSEGRSSWRRSRTFITSNPCTFCSRPWMNAEFTQDTHVGLHHPQGKKVEWEKMFRHRDRRSLEPCEPESKTGPGGCRNHALLRWREDPFR